MYKQNAEYKIAILGFGIVGQGVYEIIKNNETDYVDNIDVKYVFDRPEMVEAKQKIYDDVIFTSDIDEIVNDEEVDIVVECMGGVDFSFECFKKAAFGGKDFVTSNKALLAEKYDDMMKIAEDNFINLQYEAAVGGGVSVFHSIHHIQKVDIITGFMGIINGTTNYILTKMLSDGSSMDEVIVEAKKLGLAEADPSSDIDGVDAKYKTLLVMNYIYNQSFNLDEIINFGIRCIQVEDMKFATDNNKTIKLIACGDSNNAFVIPMFIDNTDALATVPSNYNAIEIFSNNLSNTTLVGQGASRYPTAHSVVIDIVDIVNNELIFMNDYEKGIINNELVSKFYIRSDDIDRFADIIESKINDSVFITKEVSIKYLYNLVKDDKNKMFICKM